MSGATAASAEDGQGRAAVDRSAVDRSAVGLGLFTDRARHDYLLQVDVDYRQAMGQRRLGTGIAVAGGATGFAMTVTALAALAVSEGFCGWGSSEWFDEGGRQCDHPGWLSPLLYAGLAVAAVSVAVGVPLAVSAHRRVKTIRRTYLPTPVISVDRQAAAAALTWHF
jgi:hypothetical protein